MVGQERIVPTRRIHFAWPFTVSFSFALAFGVWYSTFDTYMAVCFDNHRLQNEKTEATGASVVEVQQGRMDLNTLGLIFSGTFVDGELEGHGFFQSKDVRYEGDFVGGVYEGVGRLHYLNSGSVYTGEFMNGMPHGTGKLVS